MILQNDTYNVLRQSRKLWQPYKNHMKKTNFVRMNNPIPL